VATTPNCAYGLDNDGDGLIDYPTDPNCAGPSGATEVPEPAVLLGLAAGLAFLGTVGRRRMRCWGDDDR